ncbi:MAG: cation:proton antiporter [Microbacterium sp.]|uniref:cation:proton antiporter n=1 Tax=Microbacterium sp. TaxID=51671 RepID=UPI0039E3E362
MADLSIVMLPLLAVLAPLAARGLSRWARVPIVVFELVLGILVGPDVLGWVAPGPTIDVFAQLGLAMLFFMAGNEIDFSGMKGRPLTQSVAGWLLSLALGVAAGLAIAPGEAAMIVGVALCSTALGTLLPILRDANELGTPFGRAVSAVGAVGEFGPLIAISIFLSARKPGPSALVLMAFVLIAALAMVIAARRSHGRLHELVRASLHTSGQFAIRIVILIMGALVALSLVLELDMLLGAFAAGIIWQIIMRNAPHRDREQVESKIEAIAFGFLVPVFFIHTGVAFDVRAMVSDPRVLMLLPVFLVLLLVIRGIPATLSVPQGSSAKDRVAFGLLGATGLPVIVAVTAIGVSEHLIGSGVAAALVGAGMLSVLLFPLVAMAVRGERSAGPADGDLVAEEA